MRKNRITLGAAKERRPRDPIPEQFDSAEQAGEFWDTHSAADYVDQMEEVEVEFDIKRRTFLVPVSDHVYQLAKKLAGDRHTSVEEVINGALEHELAPR